MKNNIIIKSQKKKTTFPSFSSIFLASTVLIGVFLYWIQADPTRREELENITGTDLSIINELAENVTSVTNQASTVLQQTPLVEALSTQPAPQSSSNNLQNTELNTPVSVIAPVSSLATAEVENIVSTSNSTTANANIIQAPTNAPVLNLVTSIDPEEQAIITEQERAQALKEIDTMINTGIVGANTAMNAGINANNFNTDIAFANPSNRLPTPPTSATSSNSQNNSSASTVSASQQSNYDKVISLAFIKDLADYLVEKYNTQEGKSGTIHTDPPAVNIYYGIDMRALPKHTNLNYAREYVLNYVYTAEKLQSLYAMYSDIFINELIQESSYLGAEQQKQMFQDYSHYLLSIGKSLQAIAYTNNLKDLLSKNNIAVKNVAREKELFAQVQILYEEALYLQDEIKIDELKKDLFEISQNIEKFNEELKQVRSETLTEIKGNQTGFLPDLTMLYILEWIARRDAKNPNTSISATAELAGICIHFAGIIKEYKN